ncbi:MAG: hypothetical protein QOI74_2286 [Micromonosporaceae bacterium]|nr:hypothetical protein [Micromonosporaceae bacterium]
MDSERYPARSRDQVTDADDLDAGSWRLRTAGAWAFAVMLWLAGIGGIAVFSRDGIDVARARWTGIPGTVTIETCAHTRSYALCYGAFEATNGSVHLRRLELRTFRHDQVGRQERTWVRTRSATHAWASDVGPAGELIPTVPFALLALIQTVWLTASWRAGRRNRRLRSRLAAAGAGPVDAGAPALDAPANAPTAGAAANAPTAGAAANAAATLGYGGSEAEPAAPYLPEIPAPFVPGPAVPFSPEPAAQDLPEPATAPYLPEPAAAYTPKRAAPDVPSPVAAAAPEPAAIYPPTDYPESRHEAQPYPPQPYTPQPYAPARYAPGQYVPEPAASYPPPETRAPDTRAPLAPPGGAAPEVAASTDRAVAGRAAPDPVPPSTDQVYRHGPIRPRYLEREREPVGQQPSDAPVGADPARREWEDRQVQDRPDPAAPPAPSAPQPGADRPQRERPEDG